MSEELEKHITERYEILQKLGKGAYGIVWKARDKKNKRVVALKKVYDAFQNSTDAQRTYREVMYLQQLNGHENIVKLLGVMRAYNNKDLYLVFEIMETDLHLVIRAKILKPIHKQFIIYQLFKSLKYIHSADLVHRDLKPSNMLINSDCLMKLADFGLARSVAADEDNGIAPLVSDYIATRWYRAPEILLGSQRYSKAVDIWSAGCILAEILSEKVLFAGKSSLNQMELIIELLGRPNESDLKAMKIAHGNDILSSISCKKSRSFSHLFSAFGPEAVDLLRRLLRYNPEKRISIKGALAHPFFEKFHKEEEETECPHKICIPINDNQKLSLRAYREAIYNDIAKKVEKQRNLSRHKNPSMLPVLKSSNTKKQLKDDISRSQLDKFKSSNKLARPTRKSKKKFFKENTDSKEKKSTSKLVIKKKNRSEDYTMYKKKEFYDMSNQAKKKFSISRTKPSSSNNFLFSNVTNSSNTTTKKGFFTKKQDLTYSMGIFRKQPTNSHKKALKNISNKFDVYLLYNKYANKL